MERHSDDSGGELASDPAIATPAPPARSSTTVDDLPADIDADVRALLHRAAWIGSHGRAPLVSFSSLFLALLGGCRRLEWLKATAHDIGPDVADVLRVWKARSDRYGHRSFPVNLQPAHVWDSPPAGHDAAALDLTPSAIEVVRAAHELAVETGAPVISGRHVLAVYLFREAGHDNDLAAWGLRRGPWLARFLANMGREHRDEARAWHGVARRELVIDQGSRAFEVMRTATALARQRRAGDPSIDAETLLAAVLIDGARDRSDRVASTWLVQQLPADPLAALGVEAPGSNLPSDIAPLAVDADAWLDVAATYALAAPGGQIRTRHLVAGLLSPRAPASARRLLRKVGGEPAILGPRLQELIGGGEPDEDMATWAWLLANDSAGSELPVPGYANDEASGRDYLDIEADVHAMAAVLAAKATLPPLSVGLFGDWGSGKSFFMRGVRDRIATLASESRLAGDRGDASAYCSEVAQIEFNAWHFMDSDLWASLVSHVLDELQRHLKRGDKPPAELRSAELQTAVLKQAVLDAEVSELDTRHHAIGVELARLTTERNQRPLTGTEVAAIARDEVADLVARDPAVRRARDEVASALGVAPSDLDRAKLEKIGADLRRLPGRVAAAWRSLRRSPWRAPLVGFYLLVPVVATAIAVLFRDQWPSVVSLAVAAGTVVDAYRRVRDRTAPLRASVAEALRRTGDAEDRLRAITPRELELQVQRDGLAQRRETLSAEKAALEAEVRVLRGELERLAEESTLRHFVLDRAASDDYRKRLGVIATVHRDFRNLSERLISAGSPHVERIVLYIDDLDRCSPRRVVEVLQAIHLILSFPLFVVVVAVDSGWLLRSLQAYYAEQFGTDRMDHDAVDADWASRPQHYLEKIFQIPFTLRLLGDEGFGSMIDGLLGSQVATAGASRVPVAGRPAGAAEPSSPSPAVGPPRVTPPSSPAPPTSVVDLTPRNLELGRAELTFLRGLGPLVGSPRSAKRLVNLYRIVRAALDGAALDRFLDDRYQLAQLGLATVVGCPDFARCWFEPMFRGEITSRSQLLAHLDAIVGHDRRVTFLVGQLRTCAELDDWSHVLATCRSVARYSFETGRLLRAQPGRPRAAVPAGPSPSPRLAAGTVPPAAGAGGPPPANRDHAPEA